MHSFRILDVVDQDVHVEVVVAELLLAHVEELGVVGELEVTLASNEAYRKMNAMG